MNDMISIDEKKNKPLTEEPGPEHGLSAEELNPIITELMVAGSMLVPLDQGDNHGLAKAITAFSGVFVYDDNGIENHIVLNRVISTPEVNSAPTGFACMFKPKVTNSGATDIKIENMAAIPLLLNGSQLTTNYLNPNVLYTIQKRAGVDDNFYFEIIATASVPNIGGESDTIVVTSNTTITTQKNVMVNTETNSIDIVLPEPAPDKEITITDLTGNANNYGITIKPTGNATIDGGPVDGTISINTARGSLVLLCVKTDIDVFQWVVIAKR